MWSTKNKCCFFDDREEKSLILFLRPLEMDKQTNKVRRQSLPKTFPCAKADKDCKTEKSEIEMTFNHKVLRDTFSSGHSVSSDVLYPLLKNVSSWFCFHWLFKIYLEDSSDPNTDVGGYNVHQSKSSEAFELLDVQLKRHENVKHSEFWISMVFSR